MCQRGQRCRASIWLRASGLMVLIASASADPAVAQLGAATVGVRVAQASSSVDQFDPSYNPKVGFGFSAATGGLYWRLGVRLDYDRVAGFTDRNDGFSTPSSSTASWMTASVTAEVFCAEVCLDGSVGVGEANLDLQNTESAGPDAPLTRAISTRRSRALRLGAVVRLESFPYVEFSLARYSASIVLNRPRSGTRERSFDSYLVGGTAVLPIGALIGGR